MNQASREQTENLRTALLKLPATGAAGFEGLLAVTLTEISGIPFRLAGSGSQFGVDGKAAYENDGVSFEGKRYQDEIPRADVLYKIAELSISDQGDTELWVLGATTQVTTQLADDVRALGDQTGIATLILDWNEKDLPPLAVALAMAKSATAPFIETHVKERRAASTVLTALSAILQDERFVTRATRIRALLQEPTTGAGLARRANSQWLTDVFSNKRQAKRFLRQPLAPGDTAAGKPAFRNALIEQLKPLLSGRPDGQIAAVLGDEGTGKSWLVAQSWLSIPEKPIMAVFTSDDFNESYVAADLSNLLIEKLIAQTNDRSSVAASNRWNRKFKRWCVAGSPDSPRLVVLIDGLNQRPELDWGRLIEAMASEVHRLGGRLVVTARTAYYEAYVRRRLFSAAFELSVPEWTDGERDTILATHGICGGDLRPRVAASLRNPRLLGIALELLQTAQIKELEELSISRLLFEHMRVHERDAHSHRPAHEFARKLQEHARKILSRISARQRDDLKIFEGRLEAARDGRFFVPVDNDPTLYRIDEDGLTVALGFALLDELCAARRNKRDLIEAIEAMIEPINALDRTAEVVFAALTVACLDEACPSVIGAAIVGAFAKLQNPDADEFSAFAALAEKCPEAFMQAAESLCLAAARQPNFDWVEAALRTTRANDRAWSAMSPYLRSWLGRYSLSPETRMFSHPSREPAEKVEKERTKIQDEIDARLAALSSPERELLKTLSRIDDGDLSTLARLALRLIAGKPIAPFAIDLMKWRFATALNAGHGAPYEEFTHLVRLNRTDWPQARQAILNACSIFDAATVSRTGGWTVAGLLRATGDPDDAARANVLILELTADQPRFEGWRLVEKYCAADPCDPASAKPDNIAKTAEEYAAIDVSKVCLTMGNSQVDHFFDMARAGIVRFEPKVGVDKHRAFIADVLGRNGLALRQGMLEMRRHNAVVTRDLADQLVRRVKTGTAADNLRENDRWFVSQYHLLLAFPFLRANEQLEALLSKNVDDNILLDLMDVEKPLDEQTFEDLLDKAVCDPDERVQFILLVFCRSTNTPLSQKVRKHLAALAQSQSDRVRAQALGLIATSGDEQLIDATVKSGWSAATISGEGGFEKWYGSHVILHAAERGMIPSYEALSRITPQLYGLAARKLDSFAARDIARRIDASIRSAANLTLDIAVPDIEQPHKGDDYEEPTRYFASEKPPTSSDSMESFCESNEAFEERQKRSRAAFNVFKTELTTAKSLIILDRLGIEDFDVIAAANRSLAETWYDLFVGLPSGQRAAIHNIGLLLAHALVNWSPAKAVRLFAVFADSKPFVRFTFGRAGIPLEAMTLWSATDDPTVEGLRFDRLDKAGNDHELAIEVLAGLWSGKQIVLNRYVEDRLQTGQPEAIARALMVAGFSEHNQFNDGVLTRYKDTPGFIGKAQAAAIDAYERNIWSVRWFGLMRETHQPEDFWRYSVLFTKVVDGRFDVWRPRAPQSDEPYSLFWPSVAMNLQQRIEDWQKKREKKLFGCDAPSSVFLHP